MPVKHTTKFYVMENALNQDLGNILYNYSSNTVQFSSIGSTLTTTSIHYDRPTMILETDITAIMNGYPSNGDQVITFGPAIQNKVSVVNTTGGSNFGFSTDSVNFYPGTGTGFSGGQNAIAYNGMIWVAGCLAATNNLAYSYDGITWTVVTNSITTSGFLSVYWTGSLWLIGGSTTGTTAIAYSYDGINFIAATTSAAKIWKIASNGHIILAVGQNSTGTVGFVTYSYDGITWTTPAANLTSILGVGISSILWTGNQWVAVGRGTSHHIAYTIDPLGLTGWVGAGNTTIFGEVNFVYTLFWNGTIFVAGGNSTTNTMAYSYNGRDWIGLGLSTFTSYCLGLTWTGRAFIASGSNGGNTLARSFNGINWLGISNAVFTGSGGSNSPFYNAQRQHSITYERNLTVAGGSGTNSLAYSLNGISWIGLGTSVFSNQGLNCGYNGMIWVAGGQGGNSLAFSKNGISWTGLGSSVFSTYCFRTLWVPYLSLWVAAGLGGNTLAYSYDGMTWIGSKSKPFHTMAWGLATSSNMIIACGYNNAGIGNTLAYSMDGINWTGLGNPIITREGHDIAYNGSVWIVSGRSTSGKIAYSYNGLNWQDTGFSGMTTSVGSIKWNGSIWVAVGEGTNSTAYSNNGINWTLGTNIFSIYGRTVCWNGTMWIAGGNGTNSLAYSYNGQTWAGITGKTIFSTYCIGMASNYQVPPKAFIQHPTLAFGAGANTIAYSPDGITWTGLGALVFSTQGRRAFWNGKIWIAGGQGGNTLAYSYDGFQWTGLGSSTFTTVCNSVCYNGRIWVAVGQGSNTIAYSTNGFTWTGVTNSTQIFTTEGFGIAWNGTTFLATGRGSNTIATSMSGITWAGSTSFPFNTTNGGRHPGTNGPLWVVPYGSLSGNGLAYSFDITGRSGWNTTSIFTGGARSVTWNGQIWVATGAGAPGGIVYSRNGIDWTLITGPPLNNATPDVCWNGTRFVAYGASASYSADGITWYGSSWSDAVPVPPRVFSGDGFLASNPGVGAFVAPSAMILNNYGISGNGIAQSQTLEIVSSDPYYQSGFTNMTVKVECNNVYQ